MSDGPTLVIRQDPLRDEKYPIRLTLKRPGQADLEAEASIEFALTPQEQEDLRWCLEDYLQNADVVEKVQIEQIENLMRRRGVELYENMLEGSRDVQRIFDRVLDQLPDLRIEINTGIAEAASIPWELMRDPQSDSAIALRVKSFVRVQSNPNLSFVRVPEADEGRVRLLYVVCRPKGAHDVPLRAVANRLLQDLGKDLARYEITALRPPTFKQLQSELQDAKEAGRPYHIVHFDGHGMYVDLSDTTMAGWLTQLSSVTLGGNKSGKHGYLLFEHPASDEKTRPVSGDELGKLLHDTGVPVLVLNACQSAMHEAAEKPEEAATVHDEVRAIGSLAQAVIDQGIPAVLGMRYSVFVVTAAQYIGELYASLAKGRSFGQAATEGRKHLHRNPDRWVGLQARPLQDWFVPVVYEAMPLRLLPADKPLQLGQQAEMDPVQINEALRRYVPDLGFIGRDETLLMLDRAFDDHRIVLLHAYAGQGKTATAVEFARWYALTRGLGSQPMVLFTTFERHTDLVDVLNQIGHTLAEFLQANGIEWHALSDPQKRKVVLDVLREIPVLWIWDNVEPVAGFPQGTESAWTAEEQAELADFIKQLKLDNATRAKILLTSRRMEEKWLGGIPYRIEMPRMSYPDAARLAFKLAEEKGIKRSEIVNWGPLLDYCAGNPLTLRVLVGQAVNMGLRSRDQIERFVQAVRNGEQEIEDVDEAEGRDKSLAASLAYGFRNAFKEDELPIIALLHLFQGTVNVDVLAAMGRVGDYVLHELQSKSKEYLSGLLERARDIGLLTHIGSTWYRIHPALPWFLRQLFAEQYNGQDGRSSAEAALRAWVEAVAGMSSYCHRQFHEGNRDVIRFLAVEEDNLLHARRLACDHRWWGRVISSMQGLDQLYEYQGRMTEWARLVAEIVPEYCTTDDEPIPGREDEYSLVMDYRVRLAYHGRDLAQAAALQENKVAWDRQQAAAVLALPDEAPLDDAQRNRIRTLGVSLGGLGHILREQGSSGCVKHYQEAIRYHRRIKDGQAKGIVHYNLGHAYLLLPGIRDLDGAEAAYLRSLDLCDPNDPLGLALCFQQIGTVNHERFLEARKQNESPETLFRHRNAAEQHYQKALELCPDSAIAHLGPIHNQLGNLYCDLGMTDLAREHYEENARICQETGDYYHAAQTRHNIALMYQEAAESEETLTRQRDLLLRGRAYAEAALRDFRRYGGRCDAEEARVQRLIDKIEQELAKLPE